MDTIKKERKAMVTKSRNEGMNGQSRIGVTDSVLPDAVSVCSSC